MSIKVPPAFLAAPGRWPENTTALVAVSQTLGPPGPSPTASPFPLSASAKE